MSNTQLVKPSQKAIDLVETVESLAVALKEEEEEYNFGGGEDKHGGLQPGFVNFSRLESLLDKIRKAL